MGVHTRRTVKSCKGEVAMPVLDAKALKTDPEGLAFLRDVLRPAGTEKPAAPQKQPARPRRKILNASPSAASFEPRPTP
jgi:hypothetical protein